MWELKMPRNLWACFGDSSHRGLTDEQGKHRERALKPWAGDGSEGDWRPKERLLLARHTKGTPGRAASPGPDSSSGERDLEAMARTVGDPALVSRPRRCQAVHYSS